MDAAARELELMRAMGISVADIERRLGLVGFADADVKRIAAIRAAIEGNVDALTDTFFNVLADVEDARPLMQDRALLELARTLKREHLLAMVGGSYDEAYVAQRLRLASIYNSVRLDTTVFLGAFHQLMDAVGGTVMASAQPKRAEERFKSYLSLNKVAFFDVGVITGALIFERERIIHRQQDAIQELSTPILQLRDRMLLVPLIGVVDTYRARQLTEGMLRSIRDARARVVVMDITGVAAVDSRVANHLSQTIDAAKLMGATVIVSGISSEVATALVAVGVDVDRFDTVGDLQGGIERAEKLLGLTVVAEEMA